MRLLLHKLLARLVVLWLMAWYLAALFGMTVAPGVLAWRWFSEGVHPAIAALLALLAGTLPIMISSFAVNRGGFWDSRVFWRTWSFGWAVLGGALFLSLILD